MTDIKLEIAGQKLDVSGQSGIALTFGAQDFTQPGTRSAGFSYTISLPGTDAVHQLFHHVSDLQTDPFEDQAYNLRPANINPAAPKPIAWNQHADARLIVDGIQVFEGLARLIKVRTINAQVSFYDIQLVGDRARWATLAADLQLQDIDKYNVEACWNQPTVTAFWSIPNGADPENLMTCPFVEYGNLAGLLAPPTSLSVIDIEDLYPAFWIKGLLVHGFSKLGYRLYAPILDRYNNTHLCIPFSNGAFSSLFAKAGQAGWKGEFALPTPHLYLSRPKSPVVLNESHDQNWDLATLPDYPDYIALAAVPPNPCVTFQLPLEAFCGLANLKVIARIGYRMVFSGVEPSSTYNIDCRTHLTCTSGDTASQFSDFGIIATPPPPEIVFNHEVVIDDLIAAPGDFIYIRTEFNPFNYFKTAIDVYVEYAELEIQAHSWKHENYKFNVGQNLPANTSFLKLSKSILNMFNLVAVTDEARKEVSFIEYSDYYFDPSTPNLAGPAGTRNVAADWSDLANDNDRVDELTAAELPATILFRYEEGSDFLLEQYRATEFEYENYEIPNPDSANRSGSGTVSAAPFAAFTNNPLPNPLFGYNVAYLSKESPAELPVVNDTDVGLRIGYFRIIPDLNGWALAYDNYTTLQQWNIHPALEFVSALGDLRFAYLFARYYEKMYRTLLRSRTVSMPVRLQASHMASLNFGRPIRIGNSWFYLNKVEKYQPATPAATTVEFIQIR